MNSYPTNAVIEAENSHRFRPIPTAEPTSVSLAQPTTVAAPPKRPAECLQEERRLALSQIVFLRNLPWRRSTIDGGDVVYASGPAAGAFKQTIAAALVANVLAEKARFVIRRRECLFGLIETFDLYTERTDGGTYWLAASLERRLLGTGRVSELLYDWLGVTSSDPLDREARRIADGLLAAGLLQGARTQFRLLGVPVWSRQEYVLPERTAALLRRPPNQYEEFETWRQENPEVYELLIKEISNAFSRRTESSD